ncbi:MAG: hypothetical protein IJU89_03115 [Alphaproteobacteria bacterium]|nr:hypothetical protein [Alphaproteobacteria bacterium]
MSNKNLRDAKRLKNDEFYTRYEDIEKEVNAHLEQNPGIFKDKVVYCPCDDPDWSNFVKFFRDNFEKLGLKKLIASCIGVDGNPGKIYVLSRDGNVKLGIQSDENKR